MTHRLLPNAVLLLWGLTALCAQPTAAAERNTGPWNLQELSGTPQVDWVDSDGAIRKLYYAGEPYLGKPTRVFAYYARPEKVDGKLPAMVLVHGGGGKAFQEWADLWAKRGYAAIAMDLAGNGPDGKHLEDGSPNQTDVQKFDDLAQGVKSAWSYHAVANVIRAVSLLRSFEEVDPERVGITGISWGGYLTCIVAGLDQRLKVAVPVYGCGFLQEDSVWVGHFARMPAERRELWVKSFDPSQYLAGCAMPTLFVNGTNDFAYPLDSYQKSYRLVAGPRTLCITVRMPHGHPQGWAPPEIGLFVDSVLRDAPAFARISRSTVQEGQIKATFESTVPIKSAGLHYTLDDGQWQKRNWSSTPAEVKGNEVRAVLPAKVRVYFLTITDERGVVVSTEHEEQSP